MVSFIEAPLLRVLTLFSDMYAGMNNLGNANPKKRTGETLAGKLRVLAIGIWEYGYAGYRVDFGGYSVSWVLHTRW